ncbi:VWA domain-containing protein [Occallatibacter savannae]|uniref:VWA domain-containing protein n=1 Tax=Occallatibacter savannae TaxID=1002691 RepID=UPI000D6856F1|nr:VWA domain-containing protein [Occallatibacter savannae]
MTSCFRLTLSIALLIAGLVSTAIAEKRISVEQLEQTVAGLRNSPDSEGFQRLSDLQLTERLSAQSLPALTQVLPGEKSRQALRAIADRSQFLRPVASELPSEPAPAIPEQRRIMGLVATYVEKTIPQLPNFFATRSTDHFEDTPLLHRGPYQPLHFVLRSEASVFYQNGREVIDRGDKPKTMKEGLTTWGVFGPILGTVLVDAARSQLAWSHWERGSAGPVAVFEYHVPQDKSHYEINYCCVASQAASIAANVRPFQRIVPYHGSMTVDPTTGTIVRLILEAELKGSDPVAKAAILVDYGPVEIGGKTYTCPTRSLSTTTAEIVQVDPVYKYALANQLQPLKTSLNEVAFTNYHMFRSDMRVLTPEEADLVQQANANTPSVASAVGKPVPPAAAEPSPSPGPLPAPVPEAAPERAAAAAIPAAPASKLEAPATPEIATAEATSLPDIPSNSGPGANGTGYRLRTTTRLVEVTMVAFDKKGRPITDLKPSDFEIYDNGRKQSVSSLSQGPPQADSQPVPNRATAGVAEPAFTNRAIETSTAPGHVSTNTTMFLIDASHVAFADLTHARNEMLRFLKTVPADEPVALYVLRKYGFEVLREPTTDHDQLALTLRNWMPSAQDLAQAANEEMRNRQSMEYVRDSHDMLAVNGKTPTGSDDVTSAPDMQRRALGDTPEQNALQYLIWVARHVAAFRGHKNLIWVASDNVLADFSEKAPQDEKGDKYLEPLSLHAREALNEAQVSIYPLDSSQLTGGVVGADLQHANVQVNPTATAAQEISPSSSTLTPGSTANREDLQAMKQAQRDINPGRLTAQMQQDAHPIQGTFRELAEATGGRALRRASDIAAELDSIVNDGRAAYTLGFTPDTPADGAYHHLTVKPVSRRDVTLRYRTGYLYEKEPATLKERFQNAIWRPADQSEIALTATPLSDGNTASLNLNIAATDLSLSQQAGFWMDKLDIFLVQRDDAMFHAKLEGKTLGLRLQPATYERVLKEGISLDQPVKSLPGTGALRVVVVDENTGRIGTLTVPASAFAKHR